MKTVAVGKQVYTGKFRLIHGPVQQITEDLLRIRGQEDKSVMRHHTHHSSRITEHSLMQELHQCQGQMLFDHPVYTPVQAKQTMLEFIKSMPAIFEQPPELDRWQYPVLVNSQSSLLDLCIAFRIKIAGNRLAQILKETEKQGIYRLCCERGVEHQRPPEDIRPLLNDKLLELSELLHFRRFYPDLFANRSILCRLANEELFDRGMLILDDKTDTLSVPHSEVSHPFLCPAGIRVKTS